MDVEGLGPFTTSELIAILIIVVFVAHAHYHLMVHMAQSSPPCQRRRAFHFHYSGRSSIVPTVQIVIFITPRIPITESGRGRSTTIVHVLLLSATLLLVLAKAIQTNSRAWRRWLLPRWRRRLLLSSRHSHSGINTTAIIHAKLLTSISSATTTIPTRTPDPSRAPYP